MNEREALEKVVEAWEVLPAGMYTPREIALWIREHMTPAINEARRSLGREAFDGR